MEKGEVNMSQEKKNCKECGMFFTPGPNNSEYCPEHQRKKTSILSYIKAGGMIAGGVIAYIFLAPFLGNRDDDASI